MVRDFRINQIPRSFGYAARGIWHVLHTEQNLRIHLSAAIVAVLLGLYLDISGPEFAIILLASAIVIAAEIFNSVIEDFLDVIHPSHHESVRRIKDALAGAVLLAAAAALVVGVLIFGPALIARFG